MTIDSVVVELIDVCNLNCSYCLRDEESLRGKAHALPIPHLKGLLSELSRKVARGQVVFTGGEPTLHPDFKEALNTVRDLGWRYVVVTNGWALGRVLPDLLETRDALEAIAFSIDGIDRAGHDALRGNGSFDRLMQSVVACRQHQLPFRIKVTVDRTKAAGIADTAVFAGRLGAQSLEVGPLFPTSDASRLAAMNVAEHQSFLREIELLRATLKMPINLAAGFYDPRPTPACGPLLGTTANLDYNARLTLCTVLAGFRGGQGQADVVADLGRQALPEALPMLALVVNRQNQKRNADFSALSDPSQASLDLGSSCLHCLHSFGKIPSNFAAPAAVSLPVLARFVAVSSMAKSGLDKRGMFLLDPESQHVHQLNETAAFLWSELKEPKTLDSLVESLCRAFEVDGPTALASVRVTLAQLEARGLIRALAG